MCTCNTERPAFGGNGSSVVQARKQHTCVECLGFIEPSVYYHRFSYGPVYNPELEPPRMQGRTSHMCVGCYTAWGDYLDLTRGNVICLSQLFRCIDTALADSDIDQSASCVTWRNRFRSSTAEPSWEVGYDATIATQVERSILAAQRAPCEQGTLPV